MIQRILFLMLLSYIGLSTTTSNAQVTVANERGINTAFQEYSPAFYPKGLIFIASNPAVKKDKKEDTQLGKSTTSIFFAKRGNDGSLQRPITFAEELTTKFYDGPLSFNSLGNVVYFTRSNLKKGKPILGRDGKVKLKIYTAKLNTAKGVWQNIQELPFNSNDFDCMHPSVSFDGQRLYFASNRPGGKGGFDLYISILQKDKWSEPANLGPTVNTSKDDIFPFIHPDNTLYFASKGYKAFGGVDIFWTKKMSEGWLVPTALPEPINSSSDDFGIIVSNDKKTGFFSSNRSSGQGDDDIFNFSDPNLEAQQTKTTTDLEEDQSKTKADEPNSPQSNETQNATAQASISEKPTQTNVAPATPPAVTQIEPNSNIVKVDISAVDKVSNLPIQNAVVTVLNMKSIKNATFMTDATGKVTGLKAETGASIPLSILPSEDVTTDIQGYASLSVNKGERLIFNFSKLGYESKYVVKTFLTSDNKVAAFMKKEAEKPAIVNGKGLYSLDTIPVPRPVGSASNQTTREYNANEFEEPKMDTETNDFVVDNYSFELNNKYNSLDDAQFREDAKTELEPLMKMMLKDKRIEIEIASHTDAKGKPNFNLTISQLRADNIKTFFIERGIEPNRIRAFGYGETMGRNRCVRGVTCTEQEHAFNRRTIIKVVKGVENEPIVETKRLAKTYSQPTQTSRINNTEGADFIAGNSQNINSLVGSETIKKKYYVVIGTFTKPENADKQKEKAIDAGFVESEVIQYQETSLYAVSVRLFSDSKEAHKLADYINTQKDFEAFVKEWKH